MTGRVKNDPFVGTAGWSIPRLYAEHFPTGGSHLTRYAAIFSCVEINSSFYRPHRRSTYERWAASTPDHFRFAVKAPKAISHSPGEVQTALVDQFLNEIAGLGPKLGPILIQLPPKRFYEHGASFQFLCAIRECTDAMIALEPRHASWFDAGIGDELDALKIARVAADPLRTPGADVPAGWSGLIYHRLHGSPEIYRSSYAVEKLEGISASLQSTDRTRCETWCIFDNTASYAAVGDALMLIEMLHS